MNLANGVIIFLTLTGLFLVPLTTSAAIYCGDGIVQPGEECDDGNQIDDDGCTRCARDRYRSIMPHTLEDIIAPVKGTEEIRTKPSGPKIEGLSVTPTQESIRNQFEMCGDGIVQSSRREQCDNGRNNSNFTPNACRGNCQWPRCGDGILDNSFNEECDDGNNRDRDGCSSRCKREGCGDGITQVYLGEECDDSNTYPHDRCDENCRWTCGNGIFQAYLGEQCDDGNRRDGDGCSATCRRE